MDRDRWDERLRGTFGLSMLDHPARLQDGIRAAQKALGLEDEASLFARLDRGDSEAKAALARALTVGETYFFREAGALHHFRDVLLPAAIERGSRPVVVVSAGCSSGEEAYSLAMLARERLGPAATEQVKVIGFDLNPNSVGDARRGIYRAWSLRGMAPAVRQRWFDDVAEGASVKPEVRAMVRFEQRNLVDPKDALDPASVDVVFCRNVLIYFDDEAVKRALAQLDRGLRPGGTLIVGAAEAAFFSIAELASHGVDGETWIHGREERAVTRTVVATPVPVPRRPPPRIRSKPASDRKPKLAPAPSSDLDDVLDRGWKSLATDPLAASEDARRAILLDRTMAAAHVLAASAALALRDVAAARRALRNARRYLLDAPANAPLRGGGGATASELAGYCARLERALGGR
jgi:chemotaxis protein methyltransferase CheR